MTSEFLRAPVSNGNPREQALIRRWWLDSCRGKGEIVWEYHIDGYYIDAIWIKDSPNHGKENPGRETSIKFPLKGQKIVLCEAKIKLTPELIGQALVYSKLLDKTGPEIEGTIIFCERSNAAITSVAIEFGLRVVEYNV